MHVDFPRISPFASLRDALTELSHDRDRYAVVETEDRFFGLVCDRDLRLALPSRLEPQQAQDAALLDDLSVMSVCIRRPFIAPPSGLAIASAQFMLQKRIGCMPIVDESSKAVIGLLSLRDFARVFAAFEAQPRPVQTPHMRRIVPEGVPT